MNYENAKKITLLGLGLRLLISIFSIFNSLVVACFGPENLMKAITVINIVNLAAFAIVAVGFLLMWISDRDMIDLLAFGAAALPLVFYFVSAILLPRAAGGTIYSLISSFVYAAIYIALALKVKDSNTVIALLLVAMFAWNVFLDSLILNLLSNLVATLTALISYAASVVGAALCFLAVKADE